MPTGASRPIGMKSDNSSMAFEESCPSSSDVSAWSCSGERASAKGTTSPALSFVTQCSSTATTVACMAKTTSSRRASRFLMMSRTTNAQLARSPPMRDTLVTQFYGIYLTYVAGDGPWTTPDLVEVIEGFLRWRTVSMRPSACGRSRPLITRSAQAGASRLPIDPRPPQRSAITRDDGRAARSSRGTVPARRP